MPAKLRNPIIPTPSEDFEALSKIPYPDGLLVHKMEGDYTFDGVIIGIIQKRKGAIRYAVEDDRGLVLIMNDKQCRGG